MSKITDMLQSMIPKRFRKNVDMKKKKANSNVDNNEEDDEEEEDTPVGGVSVNEGTHEKIFGVNRNVVKGVGAFFAVILFMAMITASSDSNDKQLAQNNNGMQSTEDDINKKNKSKNQKVGQNENYGDLIEQNKKKAEAEAMARGQNINNPQNSGVNNENNENKVNASTSPQTVQVREVTPTPIIPRVTATPTIIPQVSNPTPAVAQPQPQPQTQASQPKQTEQKPQKDSRYSSAISFGVSGASSGNNSAGAGVVNATNTNGQTNQPSIVSVAPISATALEVTPRSITIGTVIPVRLMTGINSDSPGQVMAMVVSDVRDSLTGNIVLIPAGSRLFGSLGQSIAAKGRINLTFSTILTPDNRSYNIGSAFEAMDGLGYSGIKGKVDKHNDARIGGGMLAAGIAALGSLAAGNTNGNSQTYSAGQLATQGALASLISQATAMIQSGSNIGPTVTVKPGYDFSVYVNQTIQF